MVSRTISFSPINEKYRNIKITRSKRHSIVNHTKCKEYLRGSKNFSSVFIGTISEFKGKAIKIKYIIIINDHYILKRVIFHLSPEGNQTL